MTVMNQVANFGCNLHSFSLLKSLRAQKRCPGVVFFLHANKLFFASSFKIAIYISFIYNALFKHVYLEILMVDIFHPGDSSLVHIIRPG